MKRLFSVSWFGMLLLASSFVSHASTEVESQKSWSNISNQIDSIDARLGKAEREVEISSIRQELSRLQLLLTECEKVTNQQLAELQAIEPAESDDKATQAGDLTNQLTKVKQLKTSCQYQQLRLQRVKDQALAQLTALQTAYYLVKTPLYWQQERYDTSFEVSENLMFKILLVMLLGIAMTLVQSTVLTSNSKPKTSALVFLTQLASHLFVVALFCLAAIVWLEWVLDWFILLSIALTYFIINVRSASVIKIGLNYVSAAIVILIYAPFLSEPVGIEHAVLHASIFVVFSVIVFAAAFQSKYQLLKRAFAALVLAAAGFEAFEYHQLAHQALLGLFVIIMAIQCWRLVSRFNNCALSLLKSDVVTWFAPITRMLVRVQEMNPFPLNFLMTSANVTIWVSILLMLMGYLGLPINITDSIETAYLKGFKLGTLMLHPRDILVGCISFSLILLLSQAARYRIENRPPKQSKNDNTVTPQKGSEAVGALFWYSAVITAILISLSIAGFSVQNLAIVAGAFSIGIGFGLQNIVSNFISGLILLIEQPIKPGDWVAVGNTEGFVQKISIRATQLRTFDKADILIPNSELISQQVTNMMLSDRVGRIRLPIGVAYGSDTALVKKVLEDIVLNHALVIKDNPDYSPMIVFMGFGDSSLDFEVRCFLHNIADVNKARSEINFAIDQKFRENNIAIPFPQRDLHIIKDKGEPDAEL
jgi:small-conductance mechanosensitive channel